MIGADRSPPAGSGASCSFGSDGDPHHLEGYITMAWADNLTGPWNKSQHTILTSGVPGRWDAMVTNPAPLFPDKNSTTAYLFFRGTNWPLDGYERIGTMLSYSLVTSRVILCMRAMFFSCTAGSLSHLSMFIYNTST